MWCVSVGRTGSIGIPIAKDTFLVTQEARCSQRRQGLSQHSISFSRGMEAIFGPKPLVVCLVIVLKRKRQMANTQRGQCRHPVIDLFGDLTLGRMFRLVLTRRDGDIHSVPYICLLCCSLMEPNERCQNGIVTLFECQIGGTQEDNNKIHQFNTTAALFLVCCIHGGCLPTSLSDGRKESKGRCFEHVQTAYGASSGQPQLCCDHVGYLFYDFFLHKVTVGIGSILIDFTTPNNTSIRHGVSVDKDTKLFQKELAHNGCQGDGHLLVSHRRNVILIRCPLVFHGHFWKGYEFYPIASTCGPFLQSFIDISNNVSLLSSCLGWNGKSNCNGESYV
mmetsp:Transcript_7891/g.11504  ORF Transcript_7891/g.11504 Transcript_7891/m.11504 type:complete len:334 (+) Transcript_7891:1650-2651(+)